MMSEFYPTAGETRESGAGRADGLEILNNCGDRFAALLVEVGAAEKKTAPGTLQLATVFREELGAVGTDLHSKRRYGAAGVGRNARLKACVCRM